MGSLRGPALLLLAAAALLAALTLQAPFAVATFSVMLVGPLHVLLAVRYIGGRVVGAVSPSAGWLMVAVLSAMALTRAVSAAHSHLGHRLELIGGMAIAAVALWLGLRGRARLLAILPVVLVTAVSLAELPWYWHLLTHAHNVVPLIFLWDWTRGRAAAARLAFVGANLVWLLGVPAAILLGAADPLLNGVAPGAVTRLVDPAVLVAATAPPGADSAVGLRFLATFAFLQAMHYVLWLVFFQVWGRAEARRFPVRGWRFWALALGASALVWAAYAGGGYDTGRAAYGVLGAFNLYLEQPVAILLLLTALPATATSALVGRLRE